MKESGEVPTPSYYLQRRPDGRPPAQLCERLYLIRRYEERTAELFRAGLIAGTAHSCIEQEAVAGAGLREDYYIVGDHRRHGHLIARVCSSPPLERERRPGSTNYRYSGQKVGERMR